MQPRPTGFCRHHVWFRDPGARALLGRLGGRRGASAKRELRGTAWAPTPSIAMRELSRQSECLTSIAMRISALPSAGSHKTFRGSTRNAEVGPIPR